jgi:glycosyltransferase involved in cell wall biosynthesis
MRVLQLVQRPQRRGAEVFAYDLSRRLDALGVTVRTIYLYAYKGERPLPLHDGDVCLGGREGHPFERLPGFEPTLLRNIMRQIKRFRPDIVQVNGARTVKYGAAAKRLLGSGVKWKLVYRNIGMVSHWHRWVGTTMAYRNMIIPQMDGVIGVSEVSLGDVQDHYGLRAPSTVIMNGVSPDRLTPSVLRAVFRRSMGIGEDEIVLLFVGSLDSNKRPDRFLRVASRVCEAVPSVRSWIVGDGPLRGVAESMAVDLRIDDRVRFFGAREDVADIMLAADIFVITSDSEGVPAVVIEAGLFGLPVVGTDVGGLKECVIPGETGILVPVHDEEQMSAAIAALATDHGRRRRLGQAGQERVRGNLMIDAIADKYLDFYRSLLGRSDGVHA